MNHDRVASSSLRWVDRIASRQWVCVGDVQHPDFRDWAELFPRQHRFASLTSLREWLDAQDETPELILVFQSRPDEVLTSELLPAQQCAPLSEWWLVLGSWCEGETRTGFPAPGIRRVYWHRLAAELAYESEFGGPSRCRQRGVCRTWNLVDETLARAEADTRPCEFEVGPSSSESTEHRWQTPSLVFIRTLEREAYAALAEYCQCLGLATSWLPMQEEIKASKPSHWQSKLEQACGVLWVGDVTREIEQRRLVRLHEACASVPIVALLHFPRRSDVATASRCGAQAVVSLPLMVEDLRAAMRGCFSQTS